MDDEELQRIRNQRISQLQSQNASNHLGAGDLSGRQQGGSSQEDEERKRQAKQKETEWRNAILSSVLTQEARARLATIAIAKPERAAFVENILIKNVQMGAVRGQIGEDQLRALLEKWNGGKAKRETSVKFERRNVFDSDEEDYE